MDQALAATWMGTTFTITKFDRFPRNIEGACQIPQRPVSPRRAFAMGASLYDWSDPFGRLFLQTMVMSAEFEANLGHLRTGEGVAPRQSFCPWGACQRPLAAEPEPSEVCSPTPAPTVRPVFLASVLLIIAERP
ncbi:hypothetical protein [Nonomuraea insulae]|uniref:Resolvase/invertase-type recombinase catalytic domain-containing protein n=1 Tax=Nonomuraea insulae TaxID=1616787 RepID=A0ABW1DDG5_9ACTN